MPVGIHPGPVDPYAGRMATEARRRRLAQIDRQMAARRPLVDPWQQMIADDRQRHFDLRQGHQQRKERCEFEITRLERKGRTWWTDTDRTRMARLERDLAASKEWLDADELDQALTRGGSLVD
jgi:hypothetical protein